MTVRASTPVSQRDTRDARRMQRMIFPLEFNRSQDVELLSFDCENPISQNSLSMKIFHFIPGKKEKRFSYFTANEQF